MPNDVKYPISQAIDRTPGTHVFEGEEAGTFYWHTIADNSKIVAVGGESFTTAEHAWEGVQAAQRRLVGAGAEFHFDRDHLRQLVFLASGAATAKVLEDNPDYLFPAEEITERVEAVLREHYPAAAEPQVEASPAGDDDVSSASSGDAPAES